MDNQIISIEEQILANNKNLAMKVSNSSPQELTLLLYDGCLNYIKLGELNLKEKNFEKTNRYLQRAQQIINELRLNLNHQYEISQSLDQLYQFSYNQLVQGNIKSDYVLITNAKDVIQNLRDAWIKVIK